MCESSNSKYVLTSFNEMDQRTKSARSRLVEVDKKSSGRKQLARQRFLCEWLLSIVVIFSAVPLCVHATPGVGKFETIYNFTAANGLNPYGTLAEGADGNFYGTTSSGGAFGDGTVFRVTPEGTLTTLASFDGSTGAQPRASVIRGPDGNFYGTTFAGGAKGSGVVFKITPAGVLSTLISFDGIVNIYPNAGLIVGSDGNFYGTTIGSGATGSCGSVFELTSGGVLSTLYTFTSTNNSQANSDGCLPNDLVQGSDGAFYGSTSEGGASGVGTVFKVDSTGAFTLLETFNRSNGANPQSGLIQGSDGNFYGTTTSGGASGYGSIFQINTVLGLLPLIGLPPTFTTLYSFSAPVGSGDSYSNIDGDEPFGGLIQASDGDLYGATAAGGSSNNGVIYKITTSGTFTALASFGGSNGSGQGPIGKLAQGSDGNFYGVTYALGTSKRGSIFKVTPTGILSTLTSFDMDTGADPDAALLQGSDGSFYGTTEFGGSSNQGTIYKITTDGSLSTLLSFNGGNGAYPQDALIAGPDGNFYGTARRGGTFDSGTIFRLSSDGSLTSLYSFSAQDPNRFYSNIDGASPAGLILGNNEIFYGVTMYGGSSNQGTAFRVTLDGTLTTLADFDISTNGFQPAGALTLGSDGNFYGATQSGVGNGSGSIFRLTPTGVLTSLVSLDGSNGGFCQPQGSLVLGSDNNFYGLADTCGNDGYGGIFRVTPEGVLTSVASFNLTNGVSPEGALLSNGDGSFFGTTANGGPGYPADPTIEGTLFKLTASGKLITLVTFNGINGTAPTAGPVRGTDGNIYGSTGVGGQGGFGTIYRYLAPLPAPGGLSLVSGSSSADLSWSSVNGAVSYNVYQGNESGGESATPVQSGVLGTSLTLSGLSASTIYYFTVTTIDKNGSESEFSDEISTVLPPAAVTAVAGDSQVSLEWAASPGATGYNVYQGTAAGMEATAAVAAGVSATNTTVTGLTNGTAYDFKVQAVSGKSISALSNEASATPTAAASGGGKSGGGFGVVDLMLLTMALMRRRQVLKI